MSVHGVGSSGGLKLDPLMVKTRVSFSGKNQSVLKMEGTALKVKERTKVLGLNWKVTTPWSEHLGAINRAMTTNPNKFYEWVKDAELDPTESLKGVENLYENLLNLNLRYLESLKKKVMDKPKEWKGNNTEALIRNFREILGMHSTQTNLITDEAVIDQAFRKLHEQYPINTSSQLFEAINKHRNAEKIPYIILISRRVLDAQRKTTIEAIGHSSLPNSLERSDMTKTLNHLEESIKNKNRNEVIAGLRALGEFYQEASRKINTQQPRMHQSVIYIHLGSCVKLLNQNAEYLNEVVGRDQMLYTANAFRELRSNYGDILRAPARK